MRVLHYLIKVSLNDRHVIQSLMSYSLYGDTISNARHIFCDRNILGFFSSAFGILRTWSAMLSMSSMSSIVLLGVAVLSM